MLTAADLEGKKKAELVEIAQQQEIALGNTTTMKKDEIVAAILAAQQSRSGLEMASGILDILPEGYGFLRRGGYVIGNDDIYVSQSQIRRFELRRGDMVEGQVRRPKESEKYYGLIRVDKVNGFEPDAIRGRAVFEKGTPIFPEERYKLENRSTQLSTRVIDLFCPIGKGQRALIVSPPKAGKTTLLKNIAQGISINHPEAHIIALLVDERPEEVTDMQRTIDGEVVASTFDEHPENHTAVAELAMERAKRLVELGKDVVILLDSITRLARAYNQVVPTSGRTLSGGLDTASLHKPKRFFGAARKIENGGSLTIIGTALVETGSKMDDVIFEEFKGTGNMELNLTRKLAESRVFPAVDIKRSGTRREELLLTTEEMRKVWMLRRVSAALNTGDITEMILEKMAQTRNNDEFLQSVTKEALSMSRGYEENGSNGRY
ncbi:MAG: transcription termination factor Rho [Candidatus Eremiobacteraeota bacterium]|nr:transcription termination factor Rho [Candidatus Eremiobacteraeota bacterium]